MLRELIEESILIYVMLGLCGMGMLVKIVISLVYRGLMKSSDKMGTSGNKLMKLLRLKFETCYKLKIGVNNVDTFVDKYVYKHKVCGILLCTWESIGGQLLMLCMLIGTVGAVMGLLYECGKDVILSTFFAGIFTSALLIAAENILNLNLKKEIIRINIKDYLENFLKARLENEYLNPDMLEQYRREYFLPEHDETQNFIEKAAVSESKQEMAAFNNSLEKNKVKEKTSKQMKKNSKIYEVNKKEEKIIEEILKEYLI